MQKIIVKNIIMDKNENGNYVDDKSVVDIYDNFHDAEKAAMEDVQSIVKSFMQYTDSYKDVINIVGIYRLTDISAKNDKSSYFETMLVSYTFSMENGYFCMKTQMKKENI